MTTLVEAGSYMSTANPNYTDSGNGMPSLDRSPPTLMHGTPAESEKIRDIPADSAAENGTGVSEEKTEAQHVINEKIQDLKTKDTSTVSLHRDESPGEKKWAYTPPQPDASSPWAQSSASQQPTGSNAQHEHEFPFGRNDSLLDTTAALLGQSGAAAASQPKTSQTDASQLTTKLSEPNLSHPHPIGTVATVSGAMNIYMQANSAASAAPGGAAGLCTSPHDASLSASCSTTASQTPSGTPPPNLFVMNGAAHFQQPRPVNTLLYSAIGSLEVNANGSFNHKIMMSQNKKNKTNTKQQTSQFSLYDDQTVVIPPGTLIPPASAQLHQVHHTMPYQAQPITKPLPQDVSPAKNSTVSNVVQLHEQDRANDRKHNNNASAAGTKINSSMKIEPAIKNVGKEQKSAANSHVRSSSASAVGGGGPQQQTNLKKSDKRRSSSKRVTIDTTASVFPDPHQQEEMFRPFGDAYTPRMDRKKKIEYKPPQMRTPVQKMSSTMGTISRPNFRDALRRVAMIIQQHIVKIERRFEKVKGKDDKGLFLTSMKEAFCEDKFATPRYKCSMPRIPMARPGLVCAQRQIRVKHTIPTSNEIYEFAHQLFKAVQLSSECSIVCLIYIERLMEMGKVPLLASTWRPIFMCGLLLASKVWQDLSSWNIEFAIVYPQFSVDAINRLEQLFLSKVKWELYISSSLYAKYYFALRSLLEKQDFRNRYNRMVGGVGNVNASEALQIQKRTQAVKEEVISQLSRSM